MISKKAFTAESAVIEGNVSVADDCSVWHGAVIRADLAPITIGEKSNIQENCVLHVDINYPLTIGSGVTCGHGAILHGCSIGDNSLVGMGAIILNGAQIGKNCIIGAGALVTGGTVAPDNSMLLGSPAKIKRELRAEEIESNRQNAEEYVRLTKEKITK